MSYWNKMTDTRQYPQYCVKKFRGMSQDSQPIDRYQKCHETELKSVGGVEQLWSSSRRMPPLGSPTGAVTVKAIFGWAKRESSTRRLK